MMWKNAEKFGFELAKIHPSIGGEKYENGNIEVWVWPLDDGKIELEVIADMPLCRSEYCIAPQMEDLENFIVEGDYFYTIGVLKPGVSIDDVIEKFIKP